MTRLAVCRVTGHELTTVGFIDQSSAGEPLFSYVESYLEDPRSVPLSQSLPLQSQPVGERIFRPYFEGLVPEGATRDTLVARLQIHEDDYLSILSSDGLDCVGDVMLYPEGELPAWDSGSYEAIDSIQLASTLSSLEALAISNDASRLSLAGTQGKVGLAHIPNEPKDRSWLRPVGGAASTHILKTSNLSRIAEFELVCMEAAVRCGLRVAQTSSFWAGKPVCVSERFDREVAWDGANLQVVRLHQEDMAQAFGVSPRAKYVELEGGSYKAISRMILERSLSALVDLEDLARIVVFNYLIGNCDNHLKNLSVVYDGPYLRLAPAYDLVCTTFFERFSRNMGMRLGRTRVIDDVQPDDFLLLAQDLGLGVRRMRSICAELAQSIVPALTDAGDVLEKTAPSLPYASEDLADDIAPRLDVLRSV